MLAFEEIERRSANLTESWSLKRFVRTWGGRKGAHVHAPTPNPTTRGSIGAWGRETQGEGDTRGKAKLKTKRKGKWEAGELTLRDAEVATALNLTAVIER